MHHLKFQIPTNIRGETESGQEWNKRIHWSLKGLKEGLWYFMYIKEKRYGKTIVSEMTLERDQPKNNDNQE